MNKTIFAVCASFALLSACQSTPSSAPTPPNIHHVWQLKSSPTGQNIPENAQMDLRRSPASVYVGCNRMGFHPQYTPDSRHQGTLKTEHFMSTRMHCSSENIASLERSMAQLLTNGARIEQRDQQLYLYDHADQKWTFERVKP